MADYFTETLDMMFTFETPTSFEFFVPLFHQLYSFDTKFSQGNVNPGGIA